MPQDMPPSGGYEAVQYKVGVGFFFGLDGEGFADGGFFGGVFTGWWVLGR